MPAPRQVLPGGFWKLTRSCAQRQFLLRPDPDTNAIFTYCLAEAAQRYSIDVIMPSAMSNHHHTDFFDRYGHVIEFTEHFHKMVARALNAHRGRSENLWASESPNLLRLLDPLAVIDQVVYSATNPVKDGLVERVSQWPGVNGLRALLEDEVITAPRPRHFFRSDGTMPETVELRLVIPPELGDPGDVKAVIRERVRAVEEECAVERSRSGRPVVGRRAVLRQSWRAVACTPRAPRTIRPRFAARCLWRRIEALRNDRVFQDAYASARAAMLAGRPIPFPPGTYWLRRFANVEVVDAKKA